MPDRDETAAASGRTMDASAAERNKAPILEVLRRVLPPAGLVLEIASGTGQHVVHFARALPALAWQPSDPDAAMLESIRARLASGGPANVAAPIALDARAEHWPVAHAAAVLCINMIHIAPWAAALGLLRGAGRVLDPGGPLILYGPFKRHGRHTAPSNAAFDARLAARDPAWGVRDLESVAARALEHGLSLADVVPMPANNFTAVFVRVPSSAPARN